MGFQRHRQSRDERAAQPLRLLGRSGGPHPGERSARSCPQVAPQDTAVGRAALTGSPAAVGRPAGLQCLCSRLPSLPRSEGLCAAVPAQRSRSCTHREGPCTEADHRLLGRPAQDAGVSEGGRRGHRGVVLRGTLQGALAFHSGTDDSSHPVSLGCLFLKSLFLSAEKGIVSAPLISMSPVLDVQQVGGSWTGRRILHLPPGGTAGGRGAEVYCPAWAQASSCTKTAATRAQRQFPGGDKAQNTQRVPLTTEGWTNGLLDRRVAVTDSHAACSLRLSRPLYHSGRCFQGP